MAAGDSGRSTALTVTAGDGQLVVSWARHRRTTVLAIDD